MVAHRLRQSLGFIVAGLTLAAAISAVSAQEGILRVTAPSAVEPAAAGPSLLDAVNAESTGTAAVAGPGLLSDTSAALASEQEARTDIAMAGDQAAGAVTLAQTLPPAPPTSTGTAATQPPLLNERDWSDGYKTVVECTGDVARACQANVYGPNGEFVLGRTISPNGEAADCSGPCLDSTGAQLDASSVSRAQAAAAAGSPTHVIVTGAGAPPAPAAQEAPSEGEAQPIRHEGE
jgi:hypothetical protein